MTNDTAAKSKTEPKPGDRMMDGSIYAGISPDTGKPMYTTRGDAKLTMQWEEAMQFASKLNAHRHQDWRIPTVGELNVLFNNRAAIGGFNKRGSDPAGWYWSSSQNHEGTRYDGAWAQRFSDGRQSYYNFPNGDSSLRCIRG